MLWLAKTACDCGRNDLLELWSSLTLEYDNEPEMVYLGMESVGDFFDERIREDDCVCHMYFSSYEMVEYYRLCKQYEELTGCAAKQNPYCEEAERLYELYQQCVGRKQIETLTNNFLDRMQALKISIHGRLYFVPRSHMHEVSLFEDFIEALNIHNQHGTPLVVNSMFVMDDEKQRKEMAAEFYNNVRKEIEEYQERAQHLISTGSQSPAIMNRWILKFDGIEAKKRAYEEILHRQLDDLNSEFTIIRTFSQELSSRIRSIEMQRAA